MEVIQPKQRASLVTELAKPRRRLLERRPVVEELMTIAASVDLAALPWRKSALCRTLWHETNCRHVSYHLSCSEFEMLERESDGFCDICGRDLRATGTTPDIDHDHAIGWRAVRGLLCESCNVSLARVDLGLREPTRAMRYYLDNPWHARVGLEPLICPPDCVVAVHGNGGRDADA